MTGVPLQGGTDGRPAGSGPSATSPAESSPAGQERWRGVPTVRRWIWLLEHAQDVVAITVGVVLIALAAVVLIAAIADFVDGAYGAIKFAAPMLLDRVLLVLILVEIVYTVVLSLRAHRLVAQPFIVVGLIAVIREILVVLTPGSTTKVSASFLALLIGMVAVFVAGLIAVSFFEKGVDGVDLGHSEADDRG
ncbi:MAG TPA: phosphate-starvation-inducible PsiE family protein [Streptosporangiaceae bacterium]|nr:phosphate-starvation-inducible PsiE family protein [Streptosporangiaceae bacterium]